MVCNESNILFRGLFQERAFLALFRSGPRLLCAGLQTYAKSQERQIAAPERISPTGAIGRSAGLSVTPFRALGNTGYRSEDDVLAAIGYTSLSPSALHCRV
jgi:hypothetical protein